jgi:fused signal recognition particle receptor
MGFFDKFRLSRLKEGLTKTRENIFGKIQKILSGKTKIDDEVIDKIEEVLIGGDVGVATTLKIIDDIRKRVKADGFENPEDLGRLLREEIQKILSKGIRSIYSTCFS